MPPQHREVSNNISNNNNNSDDSPYHLEEAVPLYNNNNNKKAIKKTNKKKNKTLTVAMFLLLTVYGIASLSLLLLLSSTSNDNNDFSFIDIAIHGQELHEAEEFVTHTMADYSSAVRSTTTSTPVTTTIDLDSTRIALARDYSATTALRIAKTSLSTTKASSTIANSTIIHDYQWWINSDNQVLFVGMACNHDQRTYYSSRRRPLSKEVTTCPSTSNDEQQQQPVVWELMEYIVRTITNQHHSTATRRIDMKLANGSVLYLENILMETPDSSLLPKSLQSFLSAIDNNDNDNDSIVAPLIQRPHYLEQIIHDDSWVLLDRSTSSVKAVTFTTHESVEALCDNHSLQCDNNESLSTIAHDYSLRCISTNDNHDITQIIGQWRITTIGTVLVRVDWPWALGIMTVLTLLYVTDCGRQKASRFLMVGSYLSLVVLYKYIQPSNAGLFATTASLPTTVAESFHAFVAVHPLSSPTIIWSHLVTYWFQIQAWRSTTLRGVLIWYLLYELITSFVNEYTHSNEENVGVRCTRVSFIGDMKQYAVDDVIRAYLLPPFFVYLYLLPKFMCSWMV